MLGVGEVHWGLPLWESSISSVGSLVPPGRGPVLVCESSRWQPGAELWLRVYPALLWVHHAAGVGVLLPLAVRWGRRWTLWSLPLL